MKFVAALSAIAFLANEVSATCDDTHLDFNDRYRGEYIAFGGYADEGITKIACGTYGGYQDKECRILDTNVGYGSWDVSGAVPNCMANVCTIGNCGSYSNKNKCGDSDLHAPFELANAAGTFESPGNVLIYDEVNTGFSGYTDSQGSSIYPPDDNGAGASMRIEFENPAGVSIKEIDFLDIENSVSRVWVSFAISRAAPHRMSLPVLFLTCGSCSPRVFFSHSFTTPTVRAKNGTRFSGLAMQRWSRSSSTRTM
jgi:hypothetical protein